MSVGLGMGVYMCTFVQPYLLQSPPLTSCLNACTLPAFALYKPPVIMVSPHPSH